MTERLSVRDALLSFAAGEPLRAALFLTYSFDGRWFEEALAAELCERPIGTILIVRDRNAVLYEAPSFRYRIADACTSAVFHHKLALLVAEERARAVIGSANLTRGGFERQRELCRVYDLGPDDPSNHSLFVALVDYFGSGVTTELRGESQRALMDVTKALSEVVKKQKQPPATSAALLHNYAQPIWSQLLEQVPHRVLRRAVIVSPFFELDRKHPEDPPLGPEDTSIFRRMLFEDFEFAAPKGEAPVQVYFQTSEGHTDLPVRKLRDLGDRVAFFAQHEHELRLHAKLILLEGAEGRGRERFLVALYGSPNFTTAGLLKQPPHGNSELAVLTKLPTKRNAMKNSVSLLGLDRTFWRVQDLGSLKSETEGHPPLPPSQGVADITYRVTEQTIQISFVQATPPGARVRMLLLRDGSWVPIGEGDASGVTDVVIPVMGLAETDARTKLLELRGTTVRVEILSADGVVLASDFSRINVDIPEEFCGLTLIGPALLTLDERIARAGMGIPLCYREQQKWLEVRKAQDSKTVGPFLTAYQADLDRFYHNVHQGLRGIVTRSKASPGSEFTVRQSLKELSRWVTEAVSTDSAALTRECRLFLVDRLLRVLCTVTDGVIPPFKARLTEIVSDLRISQRLTEVDAWLAQFEEASLARYISDSRAHVRHLLPSFTTGKTL